MKLEWDIHELLDFRDNIQEISKFQKFMETAVKQLAKVLQDMLFDETPVKTGQLAAGWGGSENYSYEVRKTKNGYSVKLINRVPYAYYVNYGHYSYNQFGGAYAVTKRTVPYYDGTSDETFVFGHFFLEKSILKLENNDALNNVLYDELQKWFRWCINGK